MISRASGRVEFCASHPQAAALCGRHFVAEHGVAFVPDLTVRVRAGAYLHGYWQSARHFEMHGAAIRQAFQFKSGLEHENKATATLISEGPSIAIHVRRGDYVANPKALAMHGVIEPDYYIAAIKRLRASTPNARVFAFSDDPNWVRTTILSQIENSECIEHNTGQQSFRDMQLMTMCDHLVIANSSFSWWASWLNNKRKKTVIAPKHWFADPALADNSVVPAQWERM